ncbi:hypothetical protein [Haloplanus pelagicus]|jgi:hypothetical protein|uniref:hypothetical protein n=1 Tax=Haloplanus pelagicus TaxID=2949995 RepID=UPI00203E0B0C|nr:hypothetical protein [Haloplanus sp. HW8-1]
MPGEFYDLLGKITGYGIELGDQISTVHYNEEMPATAGLKISRNNNKVSIYGNPLERSLSVEYRFRISNHLSVTREEVEDQAEQTNTGLPSGRTQIETSLRRQKLQRIADEDISNAVEEGERKIQDVESSINWLTFSEDDPDLWDGFTAVARLYPYQPDFGMEDYNTTVKQVIRDGVPVAQAIYQELEELGEEAIPDVSDSGEQRHDRTYQ